MKENSNIEEIARALDEHGFAPLTADEKTRLAADPRTANFEILKRQVNILGFGELLAGSLWQQMRAEIPKIILPYRTLMGQDTLTCELSFSRSGMGNYFMDHYTIALSGTVEDTGLKYKQQTIQVEYYDTASRTPSLIEAYNLLKGRWVNKEFCAPDGDYYKDWIKYDLTMLTASGNYLMTTLGKDRHFDIASHIAQLPLADFGRHSSREELIRSLAQGNKEEVMILLTSGSRTRFKVQTNPLQDRLDIHLGNRRVYISHSGAVNIPGLKPPPAQRPKVIPGYKNINPLSKEKTRKRIRR
ncbi:hypothetical protein PV783_25030 [Chitinophaga sp. CC14]|uniref:hypothetical protein n=1 Tax=Chitinophaga sp. CC14 TaxID=3029199 RepID=UPI003B788D26